MEALVRATAVGLLSQSSLVITKGLTPRGSILSCLTKSGEGAESAGWTERPLHSCTDKSLDAAPP